MTEKMPSEAYHIKGIAQKNYYRPCPFCQYKPVKGERVIQVKDREWWHQSCRDKYLVALQEKNQRKKKETYEDRIAFLMQVATGKTMTVIPE